MLHPHPGRGFKKNHVRNGVTKYENKGLYPRRRKAKRSTQTTNYYSITKKIERINPEQKSQCGV